MTFLQMAQRLRQEGRSSGSGPASVVSQSGDSLDYVTWIQESWNTIQTIKRGWRWMFGSVVIPVTAGMRDISLATIFPAADDLGRFAHWVPSAMKYRTVAGGLADERSVWGGLYVPERDYGAVPTANKPTEVIIMPDNSLRLSHQVTEDGVLTARYYKGPQALLADADVPEMPARFHMLIVWNALIDHAISEVAQEQFERAQMRRDELWYALVNDQLDDVDLYSTTMVR